MFHYYTACFTLAVCCDSFFIRRRRLSIFSFFWKLKIEKPYLVNPVNPVKKTSFRRHFAPFAAPSALIAIGNLPRYLLQLLRDPLQLVGQAVDDLIGIVQCLLTTHFFKGASCIGGSFGLEITQHSL